MVVGLVTSITLLCSQAKEVSVSALCDKLGIKMSTIHRQVERKVIQRFRVSGFESLVKSAGLLRKVMNKIGVLDPELIGVGEESAQVVHHDDIVQVLELIIKKKNNNYCPRFRTELYCLKKITPLEFFL